MWKGGPAEQTVASIPLRSRLPDLFLSARRRTAGLVAERPPAAWADLLERARARDRAAFTELRGVFAEPLQRFVTNYLRGDVETARDIVQESFLVTWNKVEEIKSIGHLRSWLYRVARFKAINHLRRRSPNGRPVASLDASAARGHELPDTPADVDPLRRMMVREPGNPWVPALRRAIARLPQRHVAVVRLHYLRGLPTREVGTLLHLNNTTVKMRLLRARKMLRKLVLEEMREDARPED